MPALLTIQSGISQIRYATLKGIMAAKKKEIKEVTPSAETCRPAFAPARREDLLAAKDEADADAWQWRRESGAAELAQKLHVEARVF